MSLPSAVTHWEAVRLTAPPKLVPAFSHVHELRGGVASREICEVAEGVWGDNPVRFVLRRNINGEDTELRLLKPGELLEGRTIRPRLYRYGRLRPALADRLEGLPTELPTDKAYILLEELMESWLLEEPSQEIYHCTLPADGDTTLYLADLVGLGGGDLKLELEWRGLTFELTYRHLASGKVALRFFWRAPAWSLHWCNNEVSYPSSEEIQAADLSSAHFIRVLRSLNPTGDALQWELDLWDLLEWIKHLFRRLEGDAPGLGEAFRASWVRGSFLPLNSPQAIR